MDATPLNALVLTIVFSAIALYALYFVVRAGVRDGILQAKKLDAHAGSEDHQSLG